MAVELIRQVALGRIVVDEEAVQPSTENEDIIGFGHVQSPGGGLVGIERRIIPLWEDGEERSGGRWVGLVVGGFGLWKTDVVVRGASEVVVDDDVVLGPGSNEPNGALRFGQKATTGVDGRLVTVQGLEVVISEPDPSSLKVGSRVTGQVDSQKGGEALAISDVGRWALGQLKLGSSSTSKANIGIPHSSAAPGL